ncbi:Folliculin-interacting protein 1 [Apophysomyces ossiformis]|uniref:Folliculin-interacting protein 1 n=1 Tax=Apophysomyces ossiformis TaxID=679940 RepID=A0A8H7BE53_9FUNG|nr:Folliculin-interacting protein 1 [Apophysomyces ossiformis]
MARRFGSSGAAGNPFHTPLGSRASLDDRRHDWRPSSMRNAATSSMQDQTTHHHRQNNRRLDLLGDMIFGTAPLAYKGMNTKVHYKRDRDPQIVLSKLFTCSRDSDMPRRTSFSSISSDRSNASSVAGDAKKSVSTMSTQTVSIEDNASEQSSDDDQSRYSIYPPVLGLRSSRRTFNSKRSQRFSQTNMENGFRPMPLPNPRAVDTADGAQTRHTSRSIKYAIAIVITLEGKNKTLYDFIFSHFALIENRMHQLQALAFNLLSSHLKNHSTNQTQARKSRHMSYPGPSVFQHDPILVEAVVQFKNAFLDLYRTPRIQEPLWLNMSTFPQRKSTYAKSLMKELVHLVTDLDNKSHNFFISTLMTAVLSYHLSWVHTVAPPEEDTSFGCRCGNYDPLWAQLSDLYGYVGTPSRITRTVVIGRRASVVRRILYILSYLIRCNEVYENLQSLQEVDSEKIFSREHGMDDSVTSKLEDKIVRHLIGSSTDVESIAIPKKTAGNDHMHPSASLESLTDHSNLTSPSTTPNAYPTRWSSTDSNNTIRDRTWAGSKSTDDDISVEKTVISPAGAYPVDMPRSSIFHMEPDITQVKDDGVPASPAHELYAKSYGRSLMATYCDSYKSDFVIIGIPNNLPVQQLETDMKCMLQQFALSDSVTEAACVVIDANTFRCRVLNRYIDTDHRPGVGSAEIKTGKWENIEMSNLVNDILSNVRQKYDAGVSADEVG